MQAYCIGKGGLGKSSAVWLSYQQRAADYWTLAVPILQDIVGNKIKPHSETKDRIFSKFLDDPTPLEARMYMRLYSKDIFIFFLRDNQNLIFSMMSEVYMCNGELLVSKGDLDAALMTYGKAETPHASFCEVSTHLNNTVFPIQILTQPKEEG